MEQQIDDKMIIKNVNRDPDLILSQTDVALCQFLKYLPSFKNDMYRI